MRKFLLKIILSLTLISTASLPMISGADPNLQVTSDPLKCLSRDQKEKIANCFDSNLICQHTLQKIELEQDQESHVAAYMGAGGLILGFLAAALIHH